MQRYYIYIYIYKRECKKKSCGLKFRILASSKVRACTYRRQETLAIAVVLKSYGCEYRRQEVEGSVKYY